MCRALYWALSGEYKKSKDMVPAPKGAYNLVQETEYIHMK